MAEKKMPDRVQLVYKDAVDNLMFLKRQQWLVTTYALTAYAALFAVARAISVSNFLGKLLFVAAIILVAYYTCRVLGDFKKGINKFRQRVRWVYIDSGCFTQNEIQGMELGARKDEFDIIESLRSASYIGALIAAVAVLSV